MAAETEEHPFDVAKEANNRVNEMLADTDGAICSMELTGPIGYHINVASGETDPEYLWKIAFLQALNTAGLEMAHVDADTPDRAREQLSRTLREMFDPMTADYIGDEFEDNLRSLIDSQNHINEAVSRTDQ